MAEKIFNYVEDGLSYTVTLTQEGNGPVMATITVTSGFMDVNAVYFADDNHSQGDANLKGPLNMNGAGSQFDGTNIKWDGYAPDTSQPGLGPLGTSKPSFLSADGNDTMGPFVLTSSMSLDDISYLGIRATSTSTAEGSIKGVSVPEEPEDPGDCDLPDGANKVLFLLPEEDGTEYGITILSHDAPLPTGLTEEQAIRLDPDVENPTLQDYYDKMIESLSEWGELDRLDDLSEIKVYNVSDDGSLTLLGTFGVGEPLDDGSPLPIICAEEDDVVENDEDEDTLNSLVA